MEKTNFNKYIITDLLHEKNGYDGVVCTDWLVTANEGSKPGIFKGETWGVEEYGEDFVESPYVYIDGGGYDMDDREQEGNGYMPITLQYNPYTA